MTLTDHATLPGRAANNAHGTRAGTRLHRRRRLQTGACSVEQGHARAPRPRVVDGQVRQTHGRRRDAWPPRVPGEGERVHGCTGRLAPGRSAPGPHTPTHTPPHPKGFPSRQFLCPRPPPHASAPVKWAARLAVWVSARTAAGTGRCRRPHWSANHLASNAGARRHTATGARVSPGTKGGESAPHGSVGPNGVCRTGAVGAAPPPPR